MSEFQPQPHLLVVDRSPNYVRQLRGQFGADYQIQTAQSGEEALTLIADNPPDLILVGVSPHSGEGFAAAQRLADAFDFQEIPVIFLSDQVSLEEEIRALQMAAADYLSKSIDPLVLAHRMHNTLERKQLRSRILNSQSSLRQLLAQTEERQNLLASVFNATNDAIVVLDPELRVRHANNTALHFFADPGGQAEQPFGRLHTEQGDSLAVLDGLSGNDQPLECVLVTPGGQRVQVEASLNTFSVSTQGGYRLLTVSDVSQRYQLQKEREAAEAEQGRLLADLIVHKNVIDQHALVMITDLLGKVNYVNRRLCHVLGYAQDDLMDRHHSLFTAALNSEALEATLADAIAHGKSWQGEMACQARDGATHWLHASLTPWLDAKGTPYRCIMIGTDISARRKAETALLKARERELKIGSEIRGRLLTSKPPEDTHGFSMALFSESVREIDSNFISFMPLTDNCFDVLIGEVDAKDIAAALIGAAIKSDYCHVTIDLINGDLERRIPSVEAIVNALHGKMTPELIPLDAFVTLTLLRFDRDAQTVTWVNAGHPPLMLGHAGGNSVEMLEAGFLPIGILAEEHYTEQVTPLKVGDTVLLYSDDFAGVLKGFCKSPEEERMATILRLGQTRGASPSIILTSLRRGIHDDANVERTSGLRGLAIQMRPLRVPPRRTIKERTAKEHLDIPRRLDQLGALRHRVQALCADQDDEFNRAIVLAAVEAATNIIRHSPETVADTPVTAILERTNSFARVELMYQGEPFAPPDAHAPDFSGNSCGGFGLFIMECSVDEVAYTSNMPAMASVVLTKYFPVGQREAGKDN